MKYDAIRGVREIRQAVDMLVVATIGGLASAAFGLSPWLTMLAALVIYWPVRQHSEGMLWKKPTIRFAVLALTLIWLVSNWSSYRDGVYSGYDAASVLAWR